MIRIEEPYKRFIPSGTTFTRDYPSDITTSKVVYTDPLSGVVYGSPGWEHPQRMWYTTQWMATGIETQYSSQHFTFDQFYSGSNFEGSVVNDIIAGTEIFSVSSYTPSSFIYKLSAHGSLNGELTSPNPVSGTIDYNSGAWTIDLQGLDSTSGFISADAIFINGNTLTASEISWNSTSAVSATYASVELYGNIYPITTLVQPITTYDGNAGGYIIGAPISVPAVTGFGNQISGGPEFMTFTYDTPGTKNISGYSNGESSILSFRIPEISGGIISNVSYVDHWVVGVSATEWYDIPLQETDNIEWVVESNQGFVSADYGTGSLYYDGGGVTTSITLPSGTVSTGIDYINFHYNTPNTKTLSVRRLNNDSSLVVTSNVSWVQSDTVSTSVPTISSTSFYSSSLEIQQDVIDYTNRTADITLRGMYGDTYGSKTLFTIPGDKIIQWSVDNTTGLTILSAGGPVSLPTFSGSAYILSSIQLSSTDQASFVISGFYLNDTNNYDEYIFSATFEPTNLFIDYTFNNCPFTRSLTGIAKTTVDGSDYDVQGNWNINWNVDDSTNIWSATKPDGVTYNIGSSLPADDIGTIIFTVEPDTSPTPSSLTADLKLIYTTSVSAISTISFDEFPDDTIFDVDVLMNNELASHADFNGMWRVSSSDWIGNTYTANLSAFLNDSIASVGNANNYQWTFDDGSDTGITTIKTFDTTTLPAVCSITLTLSCLSGTPEFVFPHTKSVTFDMNLVTVLPSADAFIYPKYGWYDKLYRFVDLVSVADRFANEVITYGEGDTPVMWLSASNNGEIGITDVWWLSGGINNDYKTTGGKASWEVPETCVGCTTSYYDIPVLLGVFDSNTSESMASSYFDDNTGTETIYDNFSEHVIKINGYDTPEMGVSVTSNTDDSGVTIDATQTTTFADSAAEITVSPASNYLWILSGSNHYIEQLNNSQFILTSGISFGDTYNIQVSGRLNEYINQSYGGEWLSSYRTVISPQLTFEPISVYFNVSANEPYTIYEPGSIPLTGFVPFTGVGNMSTTLSPDFTATWIVGSDTYIAAPSATLSPWICSYNIIGNKPYDKNDYITEQTTIVCSVTDGTGTVGSIERTMTTRTPPNAFLDVYPVNKYTVIDEPVEVINLSRTTLPFIPISSYTWSNTYDPSVTYNNNRPFITTYPENGNQSILLSAIDNKNFLTSEIFLAEVIVLDDWVDFDPDIIRSSTVALELPETLVDIHMPPNEFVTNDNIDEVFRKLYTNLDYIDKVSKIYDVPPIDYRGWLGKDITDTTNKWHIKDVDSNYSDLSGSNGFTLINDVAIRSDGIICVADDTQVRLLSGNYSATELDQITRVTIGDDFDTVTAVDVDTRDRIFVLDKLNNKISIFEYDLDNIEPLRMISNWGGLGGPAALNSYNFPNDLMIYNNDLWITDTGNGVIKKYSTTGNWLAVYNDTHFSGNVNLQTGEPLAGSPISTAIDSSGNIHVLTSRYVVKLDSDGNFLTTYDYNSTATPQKIISSPDEGMMYIVVSDSIIKITDNGTFIGILGNNDLNYTPIFTSVLHDDNRNLYVCEEKHLLLYVDYIKILGSRINTGVVWNDIKIDKGEFVQDFVYNKTFHRFYDNLEFVRKSLYGKVVEVTEDGLTRLTTSPRTTAEWPEFNYDKTNIVIGVNEFVAAPVINRLIDQCYDCLEVLLMMVDIRE